MRKLILVAAACTGGLAALIGLGVAGALGFSLLFASDAAGAPLPVVTLAFATVVLSFGLGAALAWSARAGLADRQPDRERLLRLPGWGWWLLAFIAAVLAGYAAIEAGWTAAVALLHVSANVFAVSGVLALAVGSARRAQVVLPQRPAVGSLAWGGLGGVGLALFVEMLVLAVALVFASLWLAAVQPDLLAQWLAWAEARQPGSPDDLLATLPLLRSPWTVLALLAFVSVLVPLVEELMKAMAVPLVALAGREVRWLDGFLLGAAAGAGFALVEGTLNGVLGLAQPAEWAGALVLRGAAAAIHCAASALAGLGWAFLISRRWLPGIGVAAAAVMLHGAWNTAAVGFAARTVVGGGNILTAFFIGSFGLLWGAGVLVLLLVPTLLAGGRAPQIDRA